MEYEQKTVPLDRLTIDPANARKKYDREALDVLKASILAHGIIEPLVVRPPLASDTDLGGQLYRATAGGRRYRALTELMTEGQVPPYYEVPVIVRDMEDGAAKEISLAENFAREPMTPAEEFRAFNDLVEKGATAEDVALRFGQTERYVKGRMALAKLHPEIFAAFEEGKLSFAAACAYTVNPDQAVQFKFFSEGDKWSRNDSHTIRNAMRQAGINANSTVAQFIGEDAYRDAGGIVHADLFGDDVMWTSGELIESLKAAALERHRAEALADGWSFFATTDELGVAGPWRLPRKTPEGTGLTQDELERMDEISSLLEGAMEGDPENEKLSEEYDALNERASTYTAEQKAGLGIVIDLERVEVYFGVVKPEEKTGEDGEPLTNAAKATEKAAKDPLALTQPLKDKVGDAATAALHHAVQNDPHKALALLAASLQFSLRGGYTGGGRPTRVKVEAVGYGSRDSKAVDIRKSYDDFGKMSPDDLLKAVAFMMADTVDLTEKWFQSDLTSDDVRQKTRLHFLNAFGATAHGSFSPSDWFSSCTKPQIEAAMKEMGGTTTAQKKAGMANDAATMATITGWLPKELRHKGYALKKPEKPAKAKPARAKKEKANASE